MRDLQVKGPLAGYGPRGVIESWGPGETVTVDDDDLNALLWAEGLVAGGNAQWKPEDPEEMDEDGEPLRPVERAERAAARKARTRGQANP